MTTTLILLLLLHGVIHLTGFVKAFEIFPLKQLNESISKPFGIIWLLASLLCIASALLVLVKSNEWQVVVLAAVTVSQILVFRFWKDAKFGTVANALIIAILYSLR